MYGYQLGGPIENWSGLTNELVRYSAYGSSWTMPRVSWTTQAMRCENHPDHFAGAAVDVLHNAGLDMLQLRTYTLGREEAEDGHIIAAVVHEPKGGPLTLDPVAMQAAKTHDAMLARALAVLELCPRAAGPEWVMATYYA